MKTNRRIKDYTGTKVDFLTPLYPTDKRTKGGYVVWVCKCDCGNICEKPTRFLKKYNGDKKKRLQMCDECRRKYRHDLHTTHGETHSRLWGVWVAMRQRCENPNAHGYDLYGGRGITVCDEWQSYEVFREWALSNGYIEADHKRCTLDRIDVDKGYCPENCRWADMKTQNRNRRNTTWLTYNGVTKSLAEWAEEMGVKYQTMRKRLEYGWSVEQIIFGKR